MIGRRYHGDRATIAIDPHFDMYIASWQSLPIRLNMPEHLGVFVFQRFGEIIIDGEEPVLRILEMSKIIYSSGQVGKKATKTDAETIVKELVGNIDASLESDHGYNHWNYLKSMLSKYTEELRGLQNEFADQRISVQLADPCGQ